MVESPALLDIVGHFTWSYGERFFIETSEGNFVWSDPDYDGDNTLRRFHGGYSDWCKDVGIPYGRDKGRHVLRMYCGDDVKVINSERV
jgi:hypothetical protein